MTVLDVHQSGSGNALFVRKFFDPVVITGAVSDDDVGICGLLGRFGRCFKVVRIDVRIVDKGRDGSVFAKDCLGRFAIKIQSRNHVQFVRTAFFALIRASPKNKQRTDRQKT